MDSVGGEPQPELSTGPSSALAADPLAEILKRRGVSKVYYFHADHFEPWGGGLSAKSLRAVENFQRQTRRSPYASKLSLFYSVYVAHYLDPGAGDDGESRRVPNDSVVFRRRTEQQDRQVTGAIRPLVVEGSHEMHLHVHHEWWTRNHSHFDSPVSNWVNAHSTSELDQARLDLFFSLATSLIANETGAPFDRWGFVHGNWALAGSDPRICQIENELGMIMRHGGFGDFTFPAGRSICDPRMETPFTCLPLDLQRAYDLPEAQAMAIGRNSAVMKPDRFFIWNSKIKADHSSLDYYYAPNRDRFKQTDLMVESWLANSVVIEDRLFVKTHAHSMYHYYAMSEPGSLIPHCYPDTVAIFDRLSRACERADVELTFTTVNDVMALLHSIDGTEVPAVLQAPPGKTVSPPADLPAGLRRVLSDPSSPDFGSSLGTALATLGCGDLLGEGDCLLSDGEQDIVRYIVRGFTPADTTIVQSSAIGHSLALALAVAGFDVLAFELDPPGLEALQRGADALAPFVPRLKERLKPAADRYLDMFRVGAIPPGKKSLLLVFGSDDEATRAKRLASLSLFDDAIIGFDPSEAGSPDAGASLTARLRGLHDFVHRLWIPSEGEIWHVRPSRILGAGGPPVVVGTPPARAGMPLALDIADFNLELAALQQGWMEGEGKDYPADAAYAAKAEGKAILLKHECSIAEAIALIFDAATTEIVEIGSGCGGLSLLLARHGFAVTGYEGDRRRFPVGVSNLGLQSAVHPDLPGRLAYVPGFFPDVCTLGDRRAGRKSVCVITNVTHSYTAENQDLLLRTASTFDELILDLGRFGINRDGQEERDRLLAELAGAYYEPLELLYKQGSYEYWRLRARHPERRMDEAGQQPRAFEAMAFEAMVSEPIVCAPVAIEPAVLQPAAPELAVPELAVPEPAVPEAPALKPAVPVPEPLVVDPAPIESRLPEPEAVADRPTTPRSFPLRGDTGVLFSIYGDRAVTHCPVCEGPDTMALWRIPMSRLPEPLSIFGGSFTQVPTRETPAPIACYDFCLACHSVFLNPVTSDNKERFRRDAYFVAKMANDAEWRGYEQMFEHFAPAIPQDARIMVDAACGVGQYLRIAQKRSPDRWKRLIGLDLSLPYVEDMRRHGIEAHAFDLDSDDIAGVLGEDRADFITFCEAFEQVDHPLRVLRSLVGVLRPGGRLFFTAQRYGSDARGPVRPSEQVYLSARGLERLTALLGCRIVDVSESNMRYSVTLER